MGTRRCGRKSSRCWPASRATARFLERPAVAVVGSGFGRGDLVGRELGPYKIVAPLGAGGMGHVYRAETRARS